ncbi:MAG: tripartite tricarboxylate transporter permease [Chloroflexota bacterium]
MDVYLSAVTEVFTLSNVFFVMLGIFIGYIVGAIPGLGKVTAAAIAIPLTFSMNPVTAIGFLVGISKGSTAGNAVSAILINTPGEPSSVPTALDGYPLARQGKGIKALKVALIASTIGDFVATWVLIFLTGPLSRLAMQVGLVELASLLIFSLTFIAALSGKSLSKGLMSGLFGLLLATIGLEPETGTTRLIFGFRQLYDGPSLVAMAIGMVAIAEMIVQFEDIFMRKNDGESVEDPEATAEDNQVTAEDWKKMWRPITGGTLIGTFIGILPGLGASIASFASYGLAQRLSKTPELFGKGNVEGIAAAESADNAIIPSSLVPLVALGIPGSAIAAILAAGFAIHGMIPGPLMIRENPQFILGMYGTMLLASPLMLVIGWIGMRFFIRVISIPITYLLSAVFFFSVLGSYLEGGRQFGVYIMIIFGLVGYFVKRYDYSFVTFLIGFIIGRPLELAIRQSIIVTRGESITEYPIAIFFATLTVIVMLRMVWSTIRRIVKEREEQGAKSTG